MAHPIDVSIKTLLKTVLVVLTIWVAYLISDILMMIAFAVIITSAVDSWASKLQNIGIPRILGVISIYLAGVIFLVSVSYMIVPAILGDLGNLIDNLPFYYEEVTKFLGLPSAGAAQSLFLDRSQEILISAEDYLLQAGGGAFSFFRSVFSGIAAVVIIFILSFYLSLQEDGIKKFLQFVTPREYESYILDLWRRTQNKLGKWLQGQLILGLTVGVLVFIGLTILGVPYALVLALLAAILELIPVAGPIIASIPAIAMGFIVSPLTGILTLSLYLIIQPFENHVLVPNIMKKAVGLNPVVVIISLLVGAKLGGIPGMMLAVPIAAVFIQILGDVGEQTRI